MAYQDVRFLYANLLDSVEKVTADTQATGRGQLMELVTGTGSAKGIVIPAYTGAIDRTITIIIDSVTAGVSVGQATFKWRYNDSTGFEATGVTTSGTAITLGYGIQVYWRSHPTADDFALGDRMEFRVYADKGTQNLFDGNPNTIFESTAVDHLVFDWGSAQEMSAVVVLNHNLIAGQSTCDFQAHTADSWGDPDYDEAVTIADPIIHYPTSPPTKRYARLNPTDGALTEVTYGEIFIGSYLQLTYNAWWGSIEGLEVLGYAGQSQWGLRYQQGLAKQRTYELNYGRMLDADINNLITMQETLWDSSTGTVRPLFVHLISDDTNTTLILAHWVNWAAFRRTHLNTTTRAIPNLVFQEVPITRV